jgi:hypothetical protein
MVSFLEGVEDETIFERRTISIAWENVLVCCFFDAPLDSRTSRIRVVARLAGGKREWIMCLSLT